MNSGKHKMNKRVQEYLDQKAKERDEQRRKKKEALLELGLFEKEYYDPEYPDENHDYPECELDEATGEPISYRRVPVEVTDAEYEQILQYQECSSPTRNTIALALKGIAWLVFIGGFILGIALSIVPGEHYYSRSEFSFGTAMIYWGVSLVSGIFCLGFAEIIQLLTDLKNK